MSISNNISAEPFKELDSDILAISLVIDTSGSMLTSDPKRFREEVANVFIDFLSPEDYLGIITFNSKVDLVIPMEQLIDDEVRQSFKERLKPKLQGVANTDYNTALRVANEELENLNKYNIRKVIIFLTDGKPDPDNIGNDLNQMNLYMEQLWYTVSKISKNNFPIYSIGFSDEIDVEILNRIARETNGDVRIFKDAESLDLNLIQTLKSRERILGELLAPTSTDLVDIKPSLLTDFWLNSDGYRIGEETIVSSFLTVAGNRIKTGADLKIDNFELLINYDDGESIVLPLYDDGIDEHGDIEGNDGIWSNKLVFDKIGKARSNLIVIGEYKKQPITIEKYIGEYFVGDLGNIFVESYDKDIWKKSREVLTIPVKFRNISEFKEKLLIHINEDIGTLRINQLELEPNWEGDINLDIILNPNLQKKPYNLNIKFEPFNKNTSIANGELDYNVEIISSVEALVRRIEENQKIILPLLGLILGVPLLIYILGILFYLILLNPRLNVQGKLIYWKLNDPDIKIELDLHKKKKKTITITFDSNKEGDFFISNSEYKYDLIITNNLLKKSRKFILGWISIFSGKGLVSMEVSCTQPGIIHYDEDIFMKISLHNNDIFISGGICFHYIKPNSKVTFVEEEGRNILEGKI